MVTILFLHLLMTFLMRSCSKIPPFFNIFRVSQYFKLLNDQKMWLTLSLTMVGKL